MLKVIPEKPGRRMQSHSAQDIYFLSRANNVMLGHVKTVLPQRMLAQHLAFFVFSENVARVDAVDATQCVTFKIITSPEILSGLSLEETRTQKSPVCPR
jgi:hypothetical protein